MIQIMYSFYKYKVCDSTNLQKRTSTAVLWLQVSNFLSHAGRGPAALELIRNLACTMVKKADAYPLLAD